MCKTQKPPSVNLFLCINNFKQTLVLEQFDYITNRKSVILIIIPYVKLN